MSNHFQPKKEITDDHLFSLLDDISDNCAIDFCHPVTNQILTTKYFKSLERAVKELDSLRSTATLLAVRHRLNERDIGVIVNGSRLDIWGDEGNSKGRRGRREYHTN
jgi:hypothetical protein